ncbi:MAG: cell wall hydrolase [Candidatus Falkowbacteria bacterium]|nr:cell wall hydrolase [Candidatus Falkowbacteria bacterium]
MDNQELTTSQYTKKDARSAWNGNELCGLEKTVIVATSLSKGKHAIDLKPDQSPYLKSIIVSKVEENDKIIYFPTVNNPAQKSEGRPWLSYIILDLFITKLSILAYADKNGRDDDDLKLLINGKIQINENTKSHRDWYWCGKALKGKEKSFNQDINLKTKQFNLDLYSDETPRLSKIEIGIKPAETKRIPTVDDPLWTGDFKDDADEMILARAVFGEGRSLPDEGKVAIAWSIRNRVEDDRWADNYHDVILQKNQFSAFKIDDPNWEYVKNPFYEINPEQLTAWGKCYKIAGLVISGEIKDPTGGVNHYFSDYIDYPSWTKSKNAKFIMKIGNTLFYNLKKESNGGFIRIKYLLLALLIILIGLGVYLAILWQFGGRETEQICEAKEGRSIEDVNGSIEETAGGLYGYYHHVYINPKKSEVERIFFDQEGRFSELKRLTNDGHYKYDLKLFSSDSFRFGYFQDLHKGDEDFDENNDKQREEYYKNYTSLIISPGYGSTPIEVYRGNDHTSSWEWEDINHVKVYNNCGTCCRYYYLININTQKIEEEGHLEVEETACMQIR